MCFRRTTEALQCSIYLHTAYNQVTQDSLAYEVVQDLSSGTSVTSLSVLFCIVKYLLFWISIYMYTCVQIAVVDVIRTVYRV